MPRQSRLGRPALFSHRFGIKIRQPVSVTLSARHHRMVNTAVRRLGITRSDLFALLVEHYASTVERPPNDANTVPVSPADGADRARRSRNAGRPRR
jgi:hypothetical protein